MWGHGATWKSIYDFLFNFTGNHGTICKRFQVTALRNMIDLDFDLSRSLQVKANGAIFKLQSIEICRSLNWPFTATAGQKEWCKLGGVYGTMPITEMALMHVWGEIGKQEINITAINCPSLPTQTYLGLPHVNCH